jgi:hypothetical protein
MEHLSRHMTQGLRAVGFVGSWERDFATGLMRSSPDLATFYGLKSSGGEVEQHRFIDLEASICPDDVPRIDHWRHRCIDPAGNGTIEYRVRDRRGNVRWVLCRASYDRDDTGNLINGCGVIFDITPSKQTKSAIPSPSSNPANVVGRLADLLLEAHRLAELMGDQKLIEGIGMGLLRTGCILGQRQAAKTVH